jgi:hypothetical protein
MKRFAIACCALLLSVSSAGLCQEVNHSWEDEIRIWSDVRKSFYAEFNARLRYYSVLWMCGMKTLATAVRPAPEELYEFVIEQCTLPGNYDLEQDKVAINRIYLRMEGELLGYDCGHTEGMRVVRKLHPNRFEQLCVNFTRDARNLME